MPQMVSASWWNPLSWFEEKKIEKSVDIEVMSQLSPEPTPEKVLPVKQEPEIIEKTVIKEVKVPVEKVVEKTVTVQDQSVVNENTALRAKVKELESKYNVCAADLTKLKTSISQTEAQKKVIEVKIKEIENEIYTLNNFGYICTVSSSGSSSCQNNIGEQERWPIVSQLETKKSELQIELLKLQ